jgi:hypothetical protein
VKIKKTLWAASAAFVIAGGISVSAETANARVVCNRDGDCWTSHADVQYPHQLGIRVYDDRFADQRYRERHWHDKHHKWRDEGHDHDRGAYRNGVWVPF